MNDKDAKPFSFGNITITTKDGQVIKAFAEVIGASFGTTTPKKENKMEQHYPKVSRLDVLNNMKDVETTTIYEFGKPATHVAVRMKNGFVVRANTTCVCPENYDERVGEAICMKKIEEQIWVLLGYQLQCKIAEANKKEDETSKTDKQDDDCVYINIPDGIRIYDDELGFDDTAVSDGTHIYRLTDDDSIDIQLATESDILQMKSDAFVCLDCVEVSKFDETGTYVVGTLNKEEDGFDLKFLVQCMNREHTDTPNISGVVHYVSEVDKNMKTFYEANINEWLKRHLAFDKKVSLFKA